MSCYGTAALDAYTGALTGYGGGSTRYESLLDRKPYSSTYTSDYSYGGSGNKTSDASSAYERYCRGDYLSELTGLRTSAYTTPYRPHDTYVDDILSDVYSSSKLKSTTPIPSSRSSNGLYSRRKYVFEPEPVDILSNKLGSSSFYKTSGGYSNDSNGSSNSYFNDNTTNAYSSIRSSSRSGAIGSAPAYDRYGKELSNYERWKLSQGYTIDDEYNNNKKNSRKNNEALNNSSNNNNLGLDNKTISNNDGLKGDNNSRNGNQKDTSRSSMSRIRSSKCDDLDGDVRSGPRLQKAREFSVIPTSNSSFFDLDDEKTPSITGSRFSGKSSILSSNNMGTHDTLSTGLNRKSPTVSSSYIPTVANHSSSTYGNRSTHSFPSDVRSKVLILLLYVNVAYYIVKPSLRVKCF